jgi:NADH-quinone oxidoreductase subunit L
VLAVLGYIGAFLTAFYSFRMVFRVFFGDRVPEAVELEGGHVAHGEPMNPMTGEPEDTDVGFPGPEHHVAERAWPMKAAMGPLALLSIVGGYLAVPGLTDVIEKFLEPTFHDSRFHDTAPTSGAEVLGLVVGGVIAVLGIAGAWFVYRRRPGTTARLIERFPRAHRFLGRKWYFDELYDTLFVRPATGAGSFGRRVIEHNFVQGTIVGGATGVVRVGSSFARAIQTGYLRAYALLLLLGVAGLTLYFLLNSS